ncbi:hypothetical protein ACIRBX_07560 [Kitasatospora sp. NPDC096147]|uniref:hypothetical protein n=1 Tax=Kitasatospora sp. NPDC096147 TaxID=3364093 RepID=UPI00381FF8D4
MPRSDRLGAVLGQKLGRLGRFGRRGGSATGRLLVLTGLLLSTVLLASVQTATAVQSAPVQTATAVQSAPVQTAAAQSAGVARSSAIWG